jgi:PTS system, glucose-like IIB component
MFKKYSETIQRFGRSLLLPIGVMAPVGMIVGICGAFTQSYMIARLPFLGIEWLQMIFVSARNIANMIFNNLPVLFACGVAYGMSKKDKGIAVFATIVGYMTLIVTMNVWLVNTEKLADSAVMSQLGQATVLGVQTLNVSVFGGILAGIAGAWATDRFHNLELPLAFAFFGGKKSVPVITMVIMIITGLILPIFWEQFIRIMSSLSFLLLNKVFGPFIYLTINRLLIPFGLHHVWASLVRFTEVGGTYLINGEQYVGVLPAMNEILFNLGSDDANWVLMPELTRYMAQNQMLITLFMFPAIGLAIHRTSFLENKKLVKGLMLTLVMTAFLGNITEPLEFSFLFIAPGLFFIYAILGGIGAALLSILGTGVGYIRGTIFDFAIFGLLYENTGWINLFIVGIPLAITTYFTFKWYIEKFDVKTPGREDEPSLDNTLIKEKRYAEIAQLVIVGLGGKENMKSVENCITRLRVDLGDAKLIDQDIIKQSGASGIFFPSQNHIHVVFGPLVEFVRNAVDEELKK